MNELKSYGVEKKIIESVLGCCGDKPLKLDELEKIFELRLAGIVWYLGAQSVLCIEDDLKCILDNIRKINIKRNLAILQEIKKIDAFLEKKHISHLWLKGIRDVICHEKMIGLRKMIDSDLLVSRHVDIKSIMKEYGIKQGNVTIDGNLYFAETEEDVLLAEQGHYEYIPFVQILPVEKFEPHGLPKNIINRYHIFEQYGRFITNFVLDIHHALATGLPFKEGIQNKSMPTMESVDDLWYCMNKSYYEVWKGDKKDLQMVLFTMMKYRNSNLKMQDITNRLKQISPELYNENVFLFYEGLVNGEEEVINEFIQCIQEKLNVS